MGIHTRRRPRLSFVAVLGHSVAGSGTKCFSASRCRCFVGQSHLVVDDGSGTKYPSANPRQYLLGQSHRVVDMDPASACFPQRKFASSWSSPQANFLLTLFCWESLPPSVHLTFHCQQSRCWERLCPCVYRHSKCAGHLSRAFIFYSLT